MIKRVITDIYKRITEKPTYILGRWGKHKDDSMWKKSDLNTEDHCGCHEMREQYLHKVKNIDSLITHIQDIEAKSTTENISVEVENKEK